MEINLSIVAAGVAQTGLQAQQLGRRRAARSQQAYRQTREIQEVAAAHLRAVDENDEGASSGVHVSITGDLPEHHMAQVDKPHPHPTSGDEESIAAVDAYVPAEAPRDQTPKDESTKPLRHVDVQA